MAKHVIDSIYEKNRITSNIIQRLTDGESFMMLGHTNPDEDCIAAMVAFSLLISKFDKQALLFVNGTLHDNHKYLLEICEHNGIDVTTDEDVDLSTIDTIVACDTPKPSMIAGPRAAKKLCEDPAVVKIEFDHHIASDSDYIGDPDYALVTEASSACELIGYVGLKLNNRPELLEEYHIPEIFSRNLVLAILTGIIGDSKMGKFLKSRREQRFYNIFSGMFNELLAAKTVSRGGYFSNKEEVFSELVRLSASEQECFSFFMERSDSTDNLGYSVLSEAESKQLFDRFDEDTIVSVARSTADALSEQSGKISLIGYVDFNREGGMIQFRIRRSHNFKTFDVRTVLDLFGIKNGGGHEGAIGFRFDRDELPDIVAYAKKLVAGIDEAIDGIPASS